MNSLIMNLHKHQLYLLKQHRKSFKLLSAIIRINTEGKSLIMKLGPVVYILCRSEVKQLNTNLLLI